MNAELLVIIGVIILSVIPLFVLYFIIKAAVRNGILEAKAREQMGAVKEKLNKYKDE